MGRRREGDCETISNLVLKLSKPVARMSVATCGSANYASAPGYRYAHPGYLLRTSRRAQ